MTTVTLRHNERTGGWEATTGDHIVTVLGPTLVRTKKDGTVLTVTKFETTREAISWAESYVTKQSVTLV